MLTAIIGFCTYPHNKRLQNNLSVQEQTVITIEYLPNYCDLLRLQKFIF